MNDNLLTEVGTYLLFLLTPLSHRLSLVIFLFLSLTHHSQALNVFLHYFLHYVLGFQVVELRCCVLFIIKFSNHYEDVKMKSVIT